MEINNKPYYFRKIIATIIDYGLLYSFFWVYMSVYGEPNSENGYSVDGIYALPPYLFWFIILPLFESLFSQTIGHFIVDLKIIDVSNGGKPSIAQSFKRRIADIIDLFFFGIPAFISINKSKNNQRLGDLWSDTIVVSFNYKE